MSIAKSRFPDKLLLVDLKTMDAGEYEAAPFYEAGADICTVLGVSGLATCKGVIKAAQANGAEAQIDLINVADKAKEPLRTFLLKNSIGKNTVHAMQSGLIFGYASLINGMVSRFKMEMNAPDATVIGTGGLITSIMPHTDAINIIEPWLTLIGLREIYRLNK